MQPSDREQWLAERRHSIGASEVPTVLGVNPYETPLQLWMRKTGRMPEKAETQAMKMGKRLEPVIAQLYTEETGRSLDNLGEFAIQRNPDYPFMHATLDRVGYDPLRECQGSVQIKAPGSHARSQWDGQIPDHVVIQIQAELIVSGYSWGSAAALIGGQDFLWGDVEATDAWLAAIVEACERFWSFIKNDTPPPARGEDHEALSALFPKELPGKVVPLEYEAQHITADIERLEAESKANESQIETLKARLKELVGDAERGVLPCGTVAWQWKTQSTKGYTRVVEPRETRVFRKVAIT